MKWISVEDKLPKIDEDVLLYWENDYPLDVGSMFKKNYWQRANGDMSEYDAPPTHWMPLPEPPKIKSNYEIITV